METLLQSPQNEELQRANLIIGQFITSCSHSMRGPLKSIAGLVHLLQGYKQYSEKDVQTFLTLIEGTSLKMEHMLDGLEHFMENAKRKVAYQTTDCSEIVDRLLKKYEGEIQEAGMKVTVSIKQPVALPMDAARLQLIISNLLLNAIQFRDTTRNENWVNISVDTTISTCSILVADNGIGIAREHHEEIFDLFYRASERSSGSGVGLYVVREVVGKLGGQVRVNSEPGHGSVFTIAFPNPHIDITEENLQSGL